MSQTPEAIVLAAELTRGFEGRFVIGETCGKGAQATVFRAKRVRTSTGEPADDEVALKLYSADAVDERVLREIDTLGRVRHPCLANMLEAGTVSLGSGPAHYIAFSYVHGESLASRLAGSGALPLPSIVTVGRDVSTAVNELWNSHARIVHRDIKPANIMLRVGEREAVLLDLGVSRYTGKTPITTAGMMFGTNGYMSPEQAFSESLTSLSDVFSLGVVLLECHRGSHPTGGKQSELLKPLKVEDLIVGDASPALVDLMRRMLSFDPSDRPTPLEVRDDIATV